MQSCRSNTSKAGERAQQISCPFEFGNTGMPFTVHASLQKMHERVALPVLWVCEIGHGANDLASGSEDNFHRVIKPSTGHRFQFGSIRIHSPNSGSQPFKGSAILRFDIKPMSPVSQVQLPFWPKERPMQARGATHMPAAGQYFPLISFAIIIGIAQSQHVRRGSGVHVALPAQEPHGNSHVLSINRAFIKPPIAVPIFEHQNLALGLFAHRFAPDVFA